MTLTKLQLVTMLIEQRQFKKKDAKLFVDRFYEFIIEALENGKPVKLSGFGNFATRDKVSRPGRNPKTGKEVAISARRVVSFRAGNTLKKKVKSAE